MSRWKLFPSKTSRKISILLTLGMLIIYIGSMFVYSIYEYPKRFAPDPIVVENDFVQQHLTSPPWISMLTQNAIIVPKSTK